MDRRPTAPDPGESAAAIEAALAAASAGEWAHPLVTVCAERALRAAPGAKGPLAGAALVAKDMFDVAGVRTTYGSAAFEDRVPGATAPAVAAAEGAGAVLVGKANQDEAAWGVTGRNERWGDVANPTLPGAIPGGSSAGNAAALALGIGQLGLGTDTARSVRYPAACCGVVGFRPRTTAVDRSGCLPLAPSFDAVGPMATTVGDCAALYAVVSGTTVVEPLAGSGLAGLRVAVVEPVPAAEVLSSLGCTLVEAALPYDAEVFETVLRTEAAEVHRRLGADRSRYGSALRARLAEADRIDDATRDRAVAALAAHRHRSRSPWPADLWIGTVVGPAAPAADLPEADVRRLLGARTRVYSALDWPALAIGNLQIAGPDAALVLGVGLALEALGVTPTPARP